MLADNPRFMGVPMKKLLAEPLLQFLLLGLILTVAARLVLPPATIDDRYEIVVDEDRLLNFMQTQAKTFQPQQAAAALGIPATAVAVRGSDSGAVVSIDGRQQGLCRYL